MRPARKAGLRASWGRSAFKSAAAGEEQVTKGSTRDWALFVIVALVVVAVFAALAFQRGGSTTGTTAEPASTPAAVVSSTGTTTVGAGPVATPTTTAQVAAAYAADVWEGKPTIGLFAKDAVLQDRSSGDLRVGVKAVAKYQDFWSGHLSFEPLSQLVGSDALVAENVAAGIEYGVDVLRVRGGKIVADYVYHDDLQQGRAVYAPTPLKTPPAATDTEAASWTVAEAYMAALHVLSPARLASVYEEKVVYQDTGRDVLYVGPEAAVVGHAKMFALKGVHFQANGVLAGPGWAAVMWKRSDREGGKPLVDIPARFTRWAKRPTIHGVSILEIRDGKIARETIYCDHLRTKY